MFRFILLAVVGLVMLGCGDPRSSHRFSVSGVAASGAAVSGTVRLRDGSGAEMVQTTTIDGSYTFDVEGRTPPFVLKAEWLDGLGAPRALYSLADAIGTFNINPLTTLALADAAGVADPATLFDSPDPTTLALTATHLTVSTTALCARIAPLLASYSGAAVDPLTSHFAADHSGLDQFFDDVTVTITSGVAAIARTLDGAVLFQADATSLATGVVSLAWSPQDALIAYDPRTAVDPAGDAFVVWSQDDGAHFNIHAKIFSAASGWGSEAMVSDGAGDGVVPQVATDGAGGAMACWYQWDGVQSRIWAARYATAGGWGPPGLIDDGSGEANYPVVAADAAGDAVVAWHQFSGSRTDVWAARFTPANGWGAAEVLTDQVNSAFRPQVALDPFGAAIAVWTRAIGFHQTLWATRALAGGAWSSPLQISTASIDVYGQAAIACDASGDAIALWGESGMSGYVMTAALYRAGSGWDPAVAVGDGNFDSYSPSVAMNAAGDAVAAWKESDNTQYNIWAARFSLGGGWQLPSMVSDLSGDGGYPRAGLDGNSNAKVSWSQMEGATYSIRTATSLSGSGWSAVDTRYLNNVPGGFYTTDSFPSDLGMNASGVSLVVWGTTS